MRAAGATTGLAGRRHNRPCQLPAEKEVQPWRTPDGAASNDNLPGSKSLHRRQAGFASQTRRPAGSADIPVAALPRCPAGGSNSSGSKPWAARTAPAKVLCPAPLLPRLGGADNTGDGDLPGNHSNPASTARSHGGLEDSSWGRVQQNVDEGSWREMGNTVIGMRH